MDIFVAVIIIGALVSGAYVYLSKHTALTSKALADTKLIEITIKNEEHRLLVATEERLREAQTEARNVWKYGQVMVAPIEKKVEQNASEVKEKLEEVVSEGKSNL